MLVSLHAEPKVCLSPAPAQCPCHEPLHIQFICFPTSNLIRICIQSSHKLVVELPNNLSAFTTSQSARNCMSHSIHSSTFSRTSSTEHTTSRSLSSVASLYASSCSCRISSISLTHTNLVSHWYHYYWKRTAGWEEDIAGEATSIILDGFATYCNFGEVLVHFICEFSLVRGIILDKFL